MWYWEARDMSIVTCVTSGERGFAEIRTLSIGPCFTDVTTGNEDVTFGRSMTRRCAPLVSSCTLLATRRPVPSSDMAVASPRRVTRTSRIAAAGPAMLIMAVLLVTPRSGDPLRRRSRCACCGLEDASAD